MQRIKKGDKVRVISGKYATKEGNVLLVDAKHGRAIVEGLNKVKRHQKPSANQEKGGIKEKEAFLPLCKLALIAPKAPQGISKIKYVINKDGKKIRMAKKTNVAIAGK
jgi:large subunit ribosomal protein L24